MTGVEARLKEKDAGSQRVEDKVNKTAPRGHRGIRQERAVQAAPRSRNARTRARSVPPHPHTPTPKRSGGTGRSGWTRRQGGGLLSGRSGETRVQTLRAAAGGGRVPIVTPGKAAAGAATREVSCAGVVLSGGQRGVRTWDGRSTSTTHGRVAHGRRPGVGGKIEANQFPMLQSW